MVELEPPGEGLLDAEPTAEAVAVADQHHVIRALRNRPESAGADQPKPQPKAARVKPGVSTASDASIGGNRGMGGVPKIEAQVGAFSPNRTGTSVALAKVSI
jgi:hypothetical protein